MLKIMCMIDSHCHLSFFSEEQLKEIFEKNYCVKKLINVGTQISDEPFTGKINGCTVYNSVGIHPTEVSKISKREAEKYIEKYIDYAIAIGECGIDLHHSKNLEEQIDFLHLQCSLAEKYNKPVIIHSREVEIDVIIGVLSQYKIKSLFHCWSYGKESMLKAIANGSYISFSGTLTFKKALDIQESALYCPEDKILFETDSPFLMPIIPKHLHDNHHHFGKNNVPINVRYVYNYASILRKVNIDNLIEQVDKNFQTLFFTK